MVEINQSKETELKRSLGIFDAVMMGLGSIVGTGVFVSIAIATGIVGANIVFCIFLAGFVAMCNAFSSAQLAAANPVSGGTYEYGYRYLHPYMGFTAGWLFLAAKSASAATAALGFAGYTCNIFNLPGYMIVPLALLSCIAITTLVYKGVKRSSLVNIVIVSITFSALLYFIIVGSHQAFNNGKQHLNFYLPTNYGSIKNFLHATALMFVAYTGYGRIATMSEEVSEPRLTIPVAIVTTLVISAVLYIAVALVAVGSVGSNYLSGAVGEKVAPLEVVAEQFNKPLAKYCIAVGAVTAMLGVLLNLILGLSRVLLAMSRRGDMPASLSEIDKRTASPQRSVLTMGIIVGGLILIGNVKTTWSFSAFTVLIYYAITNLSAIKMPAISRIYPVVFAYLGMFGCLGLAFWIEPVVWLSGLALIVIGIIWKILLS